MTEDQLREIVESDTALISTRDSSCDRHEVKPWTPELNKEFRDLPRLPGDRDPNMARLNGLRMKIAACRLPFHWDIAYCQEKNEVFRLNGNTTSMLAAVPQNQELFEGATVYWTEYMCGTSDEADLIYSQFDPSISVRSPTNALMPYIVAFGVGIQASAISQILSSIAALHHVQRSSVRAVEDKVSTLYTSLPFFYWLEDNILQSKAGYAKPFFRVCVMSAIYATWLSDHRDKAVDFWNRVI